MTTAGSVCSGLTVAELGDGSVGGATMSPAQPPEDGLGPVTRRTGMNAASLRPPPIPSWSQRVEVDHRMGLVAIFEDLGHLDCHGGLAAAEDPGQ